MANRRVLVTGGHPLAAGLANRLLVDGDQVVVLAPDPPPAWPAALVVPCAFTSEREVRDAVSAAAALLGGIDQLVHTWVASELLVERAFMDIAPLEWSRACEGTLEGAWWLMRCASPYLQDGGGSVAIVIPSIALAGAAGFSMLATAAEGLRVLAKGCGRQWAQHGVTVNTVATAPHHWVSTEAGDLLSRSISLSTPAFGRVGDIADDLTPVVSMLADRGAQFLTAGTLVVDGGVWMGL